MITIINSTVFNNRSVEATPQASLTKSTMKETCKYSTSPLRLVRAVVFRGPLSALALLLCTAATQAQDSHYIYNGQRVPLVAEGARLAVKSSAAVRIAGVEPLGLPGWSSVPMQAGRSASSSSREVSQRTDVSYATPIFSAGEGRTMFPDNEILIGYAPGSSPTQVYNSFRNAALTGQSQIGNSGVWKITTNLRNGFDVINLANELSSNPGVAYAEPMFVRQGSSDIVPSDPLFGQAWGLRNTGQSGGRVGFDMAAISAWGTTTGSSSVLVAVFECGIQPNHPDLNTAPGRDFTSSPVAEAGPLPGSNTAADNHGTWVAGCISGRMNNGIGAVGVAPSVRVVSARIGIPAGGGSFSAQTTWIIAALDWASSIGARVSNHSYGMGSSGSSALDAAYQRTRAAGMVHVASAGNSGGSGVGYPASSPHVLAVGAANRFGERASFSQYGSQLDFIAPGQEIITTDRTGPAAGSSGDYQTVSGTSFSGPYAAGVAALIFSRYPSLSAAQVEQMLISSCTDMGTPGRDNFTGAGLLNAALAVGASVPPAPTPTPTPVPTPPPAPQPPAGDNNNSFETAVVTQPGGNYNEAISPAGDIDFYRVTLATAGTLTVQTTGTTDTYGILYNSSRQQLAANDDTNGLNFVITRQVTAGTYFIRVNHYSTSGTGAYQFQVRFTGAPPPTPTPTPTPQPPAGDNNNSFETAERPALPFSGARSIERAGDFDYYLVTVPSSGSLVASSTGSTDTFGILFNAQRQQVASNDDSVGYNFSIRQQVTAGTYFVVVRHYSSSGTGAYGLNISFTPTVTTPQPPPGGTPTGTRRAVVVGISDYRFINDLRVCDDDARAMRNLLQAEGWSVTTLIDSQATKAAILQAIRAQVVGASEFIFAFSGHGTRSGTTGYICTYDGNSNASFINEGELVAALSAGGPGVRVGVALDSCHSGAFIDASGATLTRFAVPAGTTENLNVPNGAAGVYFNRSLQQNGFTVLTGCASSEYSYELYNPDWNLDGDGQVGHGWLSYQTIWRLPQRASDRNGNGRSSIEEVFTFIASGYQTPQGARQTPQLYDGDSSRHFEPVAATR